MVSIQLWWNRVVGLTEMVKNHSDSGKACNRLRHAGSINLYHKLEIAQDPGVLELRGTSPCHIGRVTFTLVFLVSDFDSPTLDY